MADTPFTLVPELTAISVRYRNPATSLIADKVMPRAPNFGLKSFRYRVFDLAQGFTIPDTRVGRRGRPNQIELTGSELLGECFDYGLEDSIPNDDIAQAAAARAMQGGIGFDPLALSTETLTDLITLDREVRVAGITFNPATYPAANQIALGGGSQFDQPGVNPIPVIEAGMDAAQVVRPNKMVFGRAAWTKFRSNPYVVSAILRNAGQAGIVSAADVANLFEVQEVLIGDSYVNSAKRGQAVTLQRTWGKHIALLYVNEQAAGQQGLTWGFTAQYMGRQAWSKIDGDIGLRGGQTVRVGDSVKEQVIAPETCFFIQNAVS